MRLAILLALGAALFGSAMVATVVGAVPLPLSAIVTAALHPASTGAVSTIFWLLRLPRVLIGALVGASLAVSGTLMQGLLRNPLVDPYLTGASAGAALAIAVAIALGVSPPAYSAIAFVAALAVTLLVALLARTGTGISPDRLIIAGVSLSALFAGLTTLVILLAQSSYVSLNILAWLGGSLVGHGWHDLMWASLYSCAGLALGLAAVPALNALRLGQRRAQSIGVDVERTRWLVVIATCLLTAAAVSVSGIIGFVGLIVPHIARAAIGHDLRWTLLAAMPIGATIVILADMMARSAAPPLELPLGILLSTIGVPAFLYLAWRKVRIA